MAKRIKNIGASVRARLINIAHERGQESQLMLTRFALERLLYRLGESEYARLFVLKGAMLVTSWFPDRFRGTGDLDMLGFGAPAENMVVEAFEKIMAMDFNDGVVFDSKAIGAKPIRVDIEYGGFRLSTTATIGGARIQVMIDIGFGDALEPADEVIDYPSLLDFPTPRLRA